MNSSAMRLALMFTIDWPEPFGLAMIEALACGTPVIARPCGSVPEVLRNGVSGIIATEFDDLVKAVKNIESISREGCRKEFETRFTADVMAAQYERHLSRLDQRAPQRIEPARAFRGKTLVGMGKRSHRAQRQSDREHHRRSGSSATTSYRCIAIAHIWEGRECMKGECPMKIERLEELQQNIDALRSLNHGEGAALIGEIWRLRTAQAGKELEVSYFKDGHDRMKAELDRMSEANRRLQAENDQLKSIHGLPKCDLENRWSNCAVRMRKRREPDNKSTLTESYWLAWPREYARLRRSTNPSESVAVVGGSVGQLMEKQLPAGHGVEQLSRD